MPIFRPAKLAPWSAVVAGSEVRQDSKGDQTELDPSGRIERSFRGQSIAFLEPVDEMLPAPSVVAECLEPTNAVSFSDISGADMQLSTTLLAVIASTP